MTAEKNEASPPARPPPGPPSHVADRVRILLVIVLQSVMAVELFLLLSEGLWGSGVWLLAIMTVTISPIVLGPRLSVQIPVEYEVLAILFVFAALFLGEFRSYYERIWWWDIALHTTSGLLLGILGFLLVYVLNESTRINIYMRPLFVALFALLFAVTVGTLWEIFEFMCDQLLGTNMQKPMLGDPSGLTDTMYDLIVDTLGAVAICGFGWWNMKREERSFIDRWIASFIQRNPRFFRA